MAALFVSRPGQVVAFQDVGALPLSIFLEGWPGFPGIRAAITNVGFSDQGNFQFLHTLKQFIHVYIFGDRIGEITIGGLTFSEGCTNAGDQSGPEQVADFYGRFRIANYGQPITVQVGLSSALRFRGFLTGSRQDIVDPQHQIGQFMLRMHSFQGSGNLVMANSGSGQ